MIRFILIYFVWATTVHADAVVATRLLRAGTVLSSQDVTVLPDVIGDFNRIEQVIGLEAAYTLYPNRPLLGDALTPPALVERNGFVQLIYQNGGLTIMAEGRSLGRAGRGEMVRVMNLVSKRIIRGLAVDAATVVVMQ